MRNVRLRPFQRIGAWIKVRAECLALTRYECCNKHCGHCQSDKAASTRSLSSRWCCLKDPDAGEAAGGLPTYLTSLQTTHQATIGNRELHRCMHDLLVKIKWQAHRDVRFYVTLPQLGAKEERGKRKTSARINRGSGQQFVMIGQ